MSSRTAVFTPTRPLRAPARPGAGAGRLTILGYGALGASSCMVLVEPAPFELIALLLIALHAIRAMQIPRAPMDPLSSTLVVLLGLFTLLQAVPVAVEAADPLASATYAAVTAVLIVIGIHLGRLHGSGDPRFAAFLAGYALTALLSALVAVTTLHPAVRAMAPDLLFLEGRPKVLFKDPNVLGPHLVPATLVFLEAAARQRRPGRVLLLITCAVVCAGGVVAAASRAAWVNLAVVLVLYALFSGARQKAMLAGAALLVALVALPFVGVLVERAGDDLVELYSGRTGLQHYDSERFEAARQALELGLRHPAGVGPGQISPYVGLAGGLDPHNTYVRIWVENGPSALLLFVAILVLMALRAVHDALLHQRLGSGFICVYAVLVGSLVNASVVDALHWRHFWVIFALAVFATNAAAARRAPNPGLAP